MNTLLTIGYEKRSLPEYVKILQLAGVEVLVDVRETPWSHKPGFSRTPLSKALEDAGITYVHARFAGNPKRLRAAAKSHADCLVAYEALLEDTPNILEAFDQLIAEWSAGGRTVAITCFERHPGDCHRGILAERWAEQRNRRVRHLAPDGCARIVKHA